MLRRCSQNRVIGDERLELDWSKKVSILQNMLPIPNARGVLILE